MHAGSYSISVEGKIGGTPCDMTVDTESNITIVRPEYYHCSPNRVEETLKIVPVNTCLRTVPGRPYQCKGAEKLP